MRGRVGVLKLSIPKVISPYHQMPKFKKTLFNDFRLVGDAEEEAARKANPIIDIPLVGGLANPLFETIDELAAASEHTQG